MNAMRGIWGLPGIWPHPQLKKICVPCQLSTGLRPWNIEFGCRLYVREGDLLTLASIFSSLSVCSCPPPTINSPPDSPPPAMTCKWVSHVIKKRCLNNNGSLLLLFLKTCAKMFTRTYHTYTTHSHSLHERTKNRHQLLSRWTAVSRPQTCSRWDDRQMTAGQASHTNTQVDLFLSLRKVCCTKFHLTVPEGIIIASVTKPAVTLEQEQMRQEIWTRSDGHVRGWN